MADNVTVDNGGLTDYNVASDKITYSGDADQAVQLVKLVTVSGTEGSKTAADVTTGVQYVEDAAITANAGQGTLVVARRDDALSTLTPAEDDAVGIRTNSRGALWVVHDGVVTMTGDIAHDSPDTTPPISIGGKANTVNPTAVAANDRVQAHFDTKGNMGVFIASAFDGTGAATANTPTDAFTATAGVNSQAMASAFNGSTWDRMRSVESVSAAPNVDTGLQAVGIGPGYDRKTNPTGVAATSTSNNVEVLVNGADSVTFHVTTIGTTPGSMIFQTTGDDSAWATAGAVIKLGSSETFIEGSFVPAVDDVYLVRTTGLRRVRYKVNAVYASGTATVKVTSTVGTPIIKAVEMAPAPHKIGYAPFNLSEAVTTTAQTSVAINTAPGNADNATTSTQKAVVTSIQIQASGTVAMTQFTVYFGTGAFSRGTNRVIFDGEFAPSTTSKPGVTMNFPINPPIGAADEEVRMTTVGAGSFVINVWGYLITA